MAHKVTPWFIRLGVYVIVAAVGLVLTIMGFATPGEVDLWLAQVGSISAVIGGLLAAFNTSKKSDAPVVSDVPDNPVTVAELIAARDRAEQTLAKITDKVSRVESGEPIFSVFK